MVADNDDGGGVGGGWDDGVIVAAVRGRRDFPPPPPPPPPELPGRGVSADAIEMRLGVREVVCVGVGCGFWVGCEAEVKEEVEVEESVVMGVELRDSFAGGFRSRSRSRSRSRGVVRYWMWLWLFMFEVRERSRSRSRIYAVVECEERLFVGVGGMEILPERLGGVVELLALLRPARRLPPLRTTISWSPQLRISFEAMSRTRMAESMSASRWMVS